MKNNYEREIKNEEGNNDEEFQDDLNQNNKYFINQEGIENDPEEDLEEEDDDRLTYTLITLDLGNLIHIFEDNNISFVDMLLLSKEDLIELQLEIFQRNRILNFSKLFAKYAKNYSIREISDFFTFNKQFIFNSSIYDKVFTNNINAYENEIENANYNLENNNYDQLNQEINYINSNPNFENNLNNNNIMSKSMQNNQNNTNLKLNNQGVFPRLKESQSKAQNINGGTKKNKNNSSKNNNFVNNNDNTQDNNFHNKLLDLIKKKKNQKNQGGSQNLAQKAGGKKITKNQRNEEYQKIIEKIGLLESREMNYDFYTKLNLIKNYINNKGDKISFEDINSINNDIDSMIEIMNMNINLNLNYKNELGLNNNEINKKRNKLKVVKKQ